MGIANVAAAGLAPAIQGGFQVGGEVQQAERSQEATKQAQQQTEEGQLQLDANQQLIPADTYLKMAQTQYAQNEQDFLNNVQQPNALQEKETELQQQHQQVAQDASVYAFNQTMLGSGKQAADFVSKNKILNPSGVQYSDAQILDANGQPTNDPDQAATFRLVPADKNQTPHDVPYATLANLSRMKGTQVIPGKNGEMLVQTISPAMNKGQPMVTPAYTPTKINATREGDLYKETGPDANGQVLNGGTGGQGPLTGGALAREQKYQGIIKEANQTIFKTLGADAFGSLNPEQQPLAMRATYLMEQAIRNNQQITPAQAIAQAKQDLPILQKRGQPVVPTGYQPMQGGGQGDNGQGGAGQASDTTSAARAAFNKILGPKQAPAPAPAARPAAPAATVTTQPAPAQPTARPANYVTPAAPAGNQVNTMPAAAAGVAPPATSAATPVTQAASGLAPKSGFQSILENSRNVPADVNPLQVPPGTMFNEFNQNAANVRDALYRGTLSRMNNAQLRFALGSRKLSDYERQSVVKELQSRLQARR